MQDFSREGMKKAYIAIILVVIVSIFILIYTHYSYDPMPTQNNTIKSVSFTEQEEEGGWTTTTFYPSGYVKVEGRDSGRGYTVRLEQGWYKVANTKELQTLFDEARVALNYNPNGTMDTKTKTEPFFGYRSFTSISSGNKTVSFNDETNDFSIPSLQSKSGNQQKNSNVIATPESPTLIAPITTKEDYANKKSVIS